MRTVLQFIGCLSAIVLYNSSGDKLLTFISLIVMVVSLVWAVTLEDGYVEKVKFLLNEYFTKEKH